MPVSWGVAGAADADIDTVLTVSWNGGGEADADVDVVLTVSWNGGGEADVDVDAVLTVSWNGGGEADADVNAVLTVSWNGGGEAEAEAEAGIDTVVEKSSVECVDRELNGTKGVTCTPVADGTRLVGVGLKTMGDARVGSKLTGSKSNDSIGELLALVITSNALRSPGDNVSVAKNLTIYLLFIFYRVPWIYLPLPFVSCLLQIQILLQVSCCLLV